MPTESLDSSSSEVTQRLRIAVGIATAGRSAILSRTVLELRHQLREPDALLVCAPNADDVRGLTEAYPSSEVIIGPQGLTSQRNAILNHLNAYDVVVFFDDDFVPCPRYIASIEAAFIEDPNIVMATGRVIADGIRGEGFDHQTATRLLEADRLRHSSGSSMWDVNNGYGCNMAVRLAEVRRSGIYFDENLPFYGWLEDVDFSRQISRYGRIVAIREACGVHLGVKLGRQAGNRLGYSQIANPIYLIGKGTCSWRIGLRLMSRNVVSNLLRAVRPEPYVDRLGRLRGNLRAFLDLATGRIHPSRIRVL